MKGFRKEFTFDLKVEELKKAFGEKNYTKGWEELEKFFVKKNNFEHRQGSVYCSMEKMSIPNVYTLVEELKNSCPWLKNCLTRMDVTDIGDVHELTGIIKDGVEQENILSDHTTMNMENWKQSVEKSNAGIEHGAMDKALDKSVGIEKEL